MISTDIRRPGSQQQRQRNKERRWSKYNDHLSWQCGTTTNRTSKVDIFSEKQDNFNRSPTGVHHRTSLKDRSRDYQRDVKKSFDNIHRTKFARTTWSRLKKATSSLTASSTKVKTGTSQSQQHIGTVSIQPQHADVEVTAPTMTLESANNNDTTEQPDDDRPRHKQRVHKRKRDFSTPTMSPHGSAIDTQPDEHQSQNVNRSTRAEHLTPTPSKIRYHPPTTQWLTLIPATGGGGKLPPSQVFVKTRPLAIGMWRLFFCDIVAYPLASQMLLSSSQYLLPFSFHGTRSLSKKNPDLPHYYV